MRSVRVILRGRVQGVGYRWFVRDAARRHGVEGWVRNRRDGSVEAELHGDGASVDAVLGAMRTGPTGSRVLSLDVDEIPGEPIIGFQIRPTA